VESSGVEITSTISIEGGLYLVSVPLGANVNVGDNITFKVNGINAISRPVDAAGANTQLNLSVIYEAPPTPPGLITTYWGYIIINDQPTTSAVISVESSGVEITSTISIEGGLYLVSVPLGFGVSVGDNITFKVNGITVTSRTVDAQGTNTRLDLSVIYEATPTPPGLITTYWGYVTINDQSTTGAIVSVESNDVEITSNMSIEGGLYLVSVPRGDGGVSAGANLTFKVNGITATSRTVDAEGTNNRLDLSVGISGNPPAYGIRDIERHYLAPGGSTNITVTITSNFSQALALQEHIPSGWNLTNVSDDGAYYKSSTNEWAWLGVDAGVTKTVVYTLTVPSNAALTDYTITGEIINQYGLIDNVAGSSIITVSDASPVAPELITYTISNNTIIPPQTTSIDVAFSEAVQARIAIEDQDRNLVNELYTSSSVTDPSAKIWDGTYTNGTQVPDGSYYVNVTGESTATGLGVVNNSEIIIVASAPVPVTLDSIAVTGNATLVTGSTATYIATATYSDASTGAISAAWTSINTTVATIDATTGILTAKAIGTTTVTATSGSVSGTVNVVTVNLINGIRGDVNGDDTVNVGDITYLARYLAEWPGYSVTTVNADVNGDDAVNVGDITYLARYLAEWPGYTI